MDSSSESQSTISSIKEWRAILTLIVFILANTAVIFPFHIPIPVPSFLWRIVVKIGAALRLVPSRNEEHNEGSWTILRFHMSTIIAPLVADLFLLATLAIGPKEVVRGTLGADNTDPIEVMVFFITLAYIALSIDASGLLRFLAFKVLRAGGKHGHRLYFYLYLFFFGVTAFIGNDPIILSGTPFLAYMIRISRNIKNARAWIFAQFAMANTASAILVSSNPTNLVIAGAFSIKFIIYTVNMIVPVMITTIVLFPCLLYVIFRDEALIPKVIDMYEVDEEEKKQRKPVNPNIAVPEGISTEDEAEAMLWEIINPWMDKRHAIFSASVMAATLISVLVINAVTSNIGGHVPVYWVTAPGAGLMFTYDMISGWFGRHQTRQTAQTVRLQAEKTRLERIVASELQVFEKTREKDESKWVTGSDTNSNEPASDESKERQEMIDKRVKQELERQDEARANKPKNLVSVVADTKLWLHDTFPTAVAVLAKLPFPLLPFMFSMFVLVEALVSKGWVNLFAEGWDAWVNRTGTMGAIAGGGFLSVVLSNCTGTNIGTAILLCRIVQAWQVIHQGTESIISDRTFWGAVYSMALGLNYGAFSSTFCASLAGLLWKDILQKKGVIVGRLEFLRVNAPIITITMAVGCAVLAGEIYIIRSNSEFSL